MGSAEEYTLGSDSMPHDGVPQGVVTKHTWTNSALYPGTETDSKPDEFDFSVTGQRVSSAE